jgi:hypothetical protein
VNPAFFFQLNNRKGQEMDFEKVYPITIVDGQVLHALVDHIVQKIFQAQMRDGALGPIDFGVAGVYEVAQRQNYVQARSKHLDLQYNAQQANQNAFAIIGREGAKFTDRGVMFQLSNARIAIGFGHRDNKRLTAAQLAIVAKIGGEVLDKIVTGEISIYHLQPRQAGKKPPKEKKWGAGEWDY